MEHSRALRFSGRYFLYTTLFGILGLVGVGIGVWIVATGLTFGSGSMNGIPIPSATTQAYLGLVPMVLGVIVWRLGKGWALYTTLTEATSEELSDQYDTEHVKSDIVAVLDDRLSDMQQDLQSVNRELRSVKKEDGFEFGEE
mgnify:CR=1 FL=1